MVIGQDWQQALFGPVSTSGELFRQTQQSRYLPAFSPTFEQQGQSVPAQPPMPVRQPQQEILPPVSQQPDQNALMRDAAIAYIRRGDPSAKLQGLRFLHTLMQPRPMSAYQVAEQRRQRTLDAIERSQYSPEQKQRAMFIANIGGGPRDVMAALDIGDTPGARTSRLVNTLQAANLPENLKQRALLAANAGMSPKDVLASIGYSPAGLKAQDAETLRRDKALNANATLAMTLGTIQRNMALARKLIEKGYATTGLPGQVTSYLGGTDAFKLEEALRPIRALTGFDAINTMKQSSPTGGALGQVSDMENRLLMNSRGSLEIGQGKAQLLKNMEEVERAWGKAARLRSLITTITYGEEEDKAEAQKEYAKLYKEVTSVVENLEKRNRQATLADPTAKTDKTIENRYSEYLK